MSAATAFLAVPPYGVPVVMTDKVTKPLLAACRHLLQPLVRILIRNGVLYRDFADSVRGAYIDIATMDLSPAERELSSTRIGILTGVAARDVQRIRDEDRSIAPEVELHQVARVLQGWCQDQDFLGPYGIPLEVPFTDDPLSFEELVTRYGTGAPARALLDELIRAHAALQTEDGYVRLLNRSYLPSPLDRLSLQRLGDAVGYFIETVDFNLQKKKHGEGRFERYAITMQGISPEDHAEFDAFLRAKAEDFLVTIDDWLGEHEIKNGSALPPSQVIREGVGVFHFIENSPRKADVSFTSQPDAANS
jgi:hypothetical protein